MFNIQRPGQRADAKSFRPTPRPHSAGVLERLLKIISEKARVVGRVTPCAPSWFRPKRRARSDAPYLAPFVEGNSDNRSTQTKNSSKETRRPQTATITKSKTQS